MLVLFTDTAVITLNPAVSVSPSFYTVGRIPWPGNQPDARPLPAHRTAKTQNKRTQTSNASSGIRTHDPSVRASEDSSCLGPRGHCDRRINGLVDITHSCTQRRGANSTDRSVYK
jgi:hypothetical protein